LETNLRNKLNEIVNSDLLRKLVEIVVDKCLIGLLIVIAGGVFNAAINRGLERYKLIEAARVTDTSEVVKACAELWAKAYEYEDILGKIDRLKEELWLSELSEAKDTPEIASKAQEANRKITDLQQSAQEKREEFNKALGARSFIIGYQLELHFGQYIRTIEHFYHFSDLARARDAPEKWREGIYNILDRVNSQILSMRFDALAAREFAISKIPR
jgi:hypothetical protein